MKKKLLIVSLVLSSFLNVKAQTTFSFEASESYVLGDINTQNGWVVTGAGPGVFISGQVITDDLASEGTQSLKIDEDADFAGQSSSLMGAFYDLDAPLATTHYSISADYYMSELDGANFALFIAGAESFIARFEFDYTGVARTVEGTAWSPIPTFTWTANTWYNVKIEVDGTVVKYYVDDVLLRTGATTITEQFEHFRLTHDNWGGFAYVDNVVITDMSLGVKEFSSDFSVYPNPTNGIVTIENRSNAIVNSAQITDINGRIIRTSQVNEVSSSIDISDLSAGVYLMNIASDQGTITKKIIKN